MAKSNSKRKNIEELNKLLSNSSPLEIGEELFRDGYQLDLLGNSEEADHLYLQTIELLEDLSEQKSSPINMLDIAELAVSHGKELFKLQRFSKAKLAFCRAVEIFDSLLVLDADSMGVKKLATALMWKARCMRKCKEFDDSIEIYERATGIFKMLKELGINAKERSECRIYIGTCLLGLSKSLGSLGKKELSEMIASESSEILEPILRIRNL